jgi:hypothetical protein
MGKRTAIAPTAVPELPSIGGQVCGWLFRRPRAWAWNLVAPPRVRKQAWRDGYCAGLLLGEGYRNQRQTPWHHRDLHAWQAGLRDGAELAARRGHPDRKAVHMPPLPSRRGLLLVWLLPGERGLSRCVAEGDRAGEVGYGSLNER